MQTETADNLRPPTSRATALALLGITVGLALSLPWLSGGGVLATAATVLAAGLGAGTFAAVGSVTRPSRRRAREETISEVDIDLGEEQAGRVPVQWRKGHSGDIVPIAFWDAARSRWRPPRDLREWLALHRAVADHLAPEPPPNGSANLRRASSSLGRITRRQ